jgi:hypothetical protein
MSYEMGEAALEGEVASLTRQLKECKKRRAKGELIAAAPLMKCGNTLEFNQRLQWLSEGMLANHLNSVVNYTPNQTEIALYHKYKADISK